MHDDTRVRISDLKSSIKELKNTANKIKVEIQEKEKHFQNCG